MLDGDHFLFYDSEEALKTEVARWSWVPPDHQPISQTDRFEVEELRPLSG